MDFLRLDDVLAVQEHTPKISRWIFDSGPRFFEALFGNADQAIESLGAWVERDSSEFCGLQATLACVDAAPAGMFIGVRGDEISRRRRADLLALVQNTPPSERARLRAKLEEIAGLTATVDASDYYIRTLAVDPLQRRRSVGRRLLERALEEARAKGFARVRLDVDSDNAVARQLYAGVGFASIYEGAAPSLGLHMQSLALKF